MIRKIVNKTHQRVSNLLILDNIRSSENVGSIFRTADSLGVDKLYLVGITPAPRDKFGRPNGKIAKASLGAEATTSFAIVKTIVPLIKKLKSEGYKIIAIEQAKNSIDYKKIKISNKNAFIVGNEVRGILPSTLKHADIVAEIPMRGRKESLNVSVSVGVALFRILGQ